MYIDYVASEVTRVHTWIVPEDGFSQRFLKLALKMFLVLYRKVVVVED